MKGTIITRDERRAEVQPEAQARQVQALDRPESVQIEYPADRSQPPTVRVTIATYFDGRLVAREGFVAAPMPPGLARQLEAWAISAQPAAPEPETTRMEDDAVVLLED